MTSSKSEAPTVLIPFPFLSHAHTVTGPAPARRESAPSAAQKLTQLRPARPSMRDDIAT
jgi:hypothetical protein